jgi:nucleoside 2-deoxyribosyltransferase
MVKKKMTKKIFVTASFKADGSNNNDIEALCAVVRESGLEEYCFARDQKSFDDLKELWQVALSEIKKCDGLLVDVTNISVGGRVVEVGIAYGLGLPIVVIAKNGSTVPEVFLGIATETIRYDSYKDIGRPLSKLFI